MSILKYFHSLWDKIFLHIDTKILAGKNAVLWELLGIWQLSFVTLQMDTFPDGILLFASLVSTVLNAIHSQEKDSKKFAWVNW